MVMKGQKNTCNFKLHAGKNDKKLRLGERNEFIYTALTVSSFAVCPAFARLFLLLFFIFFVAFFLFRKLA